MSKEGMNMFGKKLPKIDVSKPGSGQARTQQSVASKHKKSVSSTIAVYGTSTIIGKAKAN
jgi:hypothetical protein